ncbi:MAG: hypothetical protein ACHQII_08295, partial [Bacteroidia bacterium]
YNKGFYVSNPTSAKINNRNTAIDSSAFFTKNESGLHKNKKATAFAPTSEETTSEVEKTSLHDSIAEIRKTKTVYTIFYIPTTQSKKDANKIKELRDLKKPKPTSEPNGSNPFAIPAFIFTVLGIVLIVSLIFLSAASNFILGLLIIFPAIIFWILGVVFSLLSFGVAASNDFKPIKNHIFGIIALALNILIVGTVVFILTRH